MTLESRPARYIVDLSRPGHEIVVTATFDDPLPTRTTCDVALFMPRWAPGSYLVREFARHVDWIRARQGAVERRVRKTGTDEWIVEGCDGSSLVVEYGLHAHELTVRTNYLAADRALLSGAATFLRLADREPAPIRVGLVEPPAWPEAQCALPREGGEFVARDFDELVDSPIAAGPCSISDFEVRGVPHRIAVYGQGDVDAAGVLDEVKAIVEASAAIFDDIPCERYLFIIEIGCGGGLEHAASSVCGFQVLARPAPADWRRHATLVAHEYFHLWNVKRIRPAALGPFDYRREAHTPHLWVAEGLTSYYQNLIGLRAGVLGPARYLCMLAGQVLDLESTPGRFVQSLEESSHDAWIKYYRPHENTRNATISYYGKGAVAGLVLDLEIRARTAGERSLDDSFRTLYRLWKERPGRGYSDDELAAALSGAAGRSMDEVIEEVSRGRGDLDVDSRLAAAGLELVRRPPGRGAWLGILTRRGDGKVLVDRIVKDGPAWAAGLAPGEEVVAIDGFRVDDGELATRLEAGKPGDEIVVTSALWGRLREVKLVAGAKPRTDYRFRKIADASPKARAVAEGWLGAKWADLELLDEAPEHDGGGRALRTV